ncbi:MAG TPA: nuclear transport factor 2 family protein [Bryobacteraceae bacterium]|jgi:hypothetical protein
MSNETNRQKLERFFHAFHYGTIQSELMHPDFLVEEADALPYGGVYRGLRGCEALARKISATWSDIEITTQFILGNENADQFAAMQRMKGRSRRSGTPFDTTVFELWSFRDGLITEVRPYYWDTKMMADIGAGK